MFDIEERFIKLMTSNRDLRMELFQYIYELKKEDKEVNTLEVAERLIEIMNK